ncbi:MAG: 3-hydroxyacyl-CoA dehydrogenase family protein [Chlamydiia bacterium]|nr:3-hydroxyacyl-CoA dehydrogenase family protein [Chlamydiia bacterium]
MRDLFENVAVIGAAGKMGRGIAELFFLQMAKLGLESGKKRRLVLIDVDEEAVFSLNFKKPLRTFAEKNINALRKLYDEVSNQEVIDAFLEEMAFVLRPGTSLEAANSCSVICEAAAEDPSLKELIFSRVKEADAYFYTNTSSIPIHEIASRSGLEGRLAGLHFYNPPQVQKLIELIIPKGCLPEVKQGAVAIAESFGKTIIYSEDVAGFIGNGHFLREIAFACDLVAKSDDLPRAIWEIDRMTREDLLRPMGIFQLLDFVGIDVALKIAEVMEKRLGESFVKPLLQLGLIGGQNPDGTQKNGFLSYEGRRPVGVFDPLLKEYRPMKGEFAERWKALLKDPQREEKVRAYEKELKGPSLEFLQKSRSLQKKLVETGVAHSLEDVRAVLQNGFYHVLT